MKLAEFPPKIQIEICNFCNAKCTTCPISKMKRKPEIMDFELFSRIIHELEEREFAGQILPFLNGEPLLVPNLLDYLRLIKTRVPKSTVTLYTNASKLNDELGRAIIRESLLDILFISFDGGTKESYESICRGLSFESVKENVHCFLQNSDKLQMGKPKVLITMVITPENCHTRKELREEFKDADEIQFCFKFNYGGQLGGLGGKETSGWKQFLTKGNFCRQMYDLFNILVNGDVALCCFDYEGREIVGNIKSNSIKEVWLGETFENKRKALRKRMFSELPLCRDCDVLNHNLIVQQLIKAQPLIATRFPNIARSVLNLYKSALLRK